MPGVQVVGSQFIDDRGAARFGQGIGKFGAGIASLIEVSRKAKQQKRETKFYNELLQIPDPDSRRQFVLNTLARESQEQVALEQQRQSSGFLERFMGDIGGSFKFQSIVPKQVKDFLIAEAFADPDIQKKQDLEQEKLRLLIETARARDPVNLQILQNRNALLENELANEVNEDKRRELDFQIKQNRNALLENQLANEPDEDKRRALERDALSKRIDLLDIQIAESKKVKTLTLQQLRDAQAIKTGAIPGTQAFEDIAKGPIKPEEPELLSRSVRKDIAQFGKQTRPGEKKLTDDQELNRIAGLLAQAANSGLTPEIESELNASRLVNNFLQINTQIEKPSEKGEPGKSAKDLIEEIVQSEGGDTNRSEEVYKKARDKFIITTAQAEFRPDSSGPVFDRWWDEQVKKGTHTVGATLGFGGDERTFAPRPQVGQQQFNVTITDPRTKENIIVPKDILEQDRKEGETVVYDPKTKQFGFFPNDKLDEAKKAGFVVVSESANFESQDAGPRGGLPSNINIGEHLAAGGGGRNTSPQFAGGKEGFLQEGGAIGPIKDFAGPGGAIGPIKRFDEKGGIIGLRQQDLIKNPPHPALKSIWPSLSVQRKRQAIALFDRGVSISTILKAVSK